MKRISFMALACATLLTACNSTPTEQDYIDAFIDHSSNSPIAKESVTIQKIQDITVADSLQYIATTLAHEYNNMLAEKKLVWENKVADCEKDELANKLRHEDYMKKYNDAKRRYGNDIKYKNKIEGYLKAAQKLPATHEEYLKFDRSRSYSFTRDAENLQADYEAFLALGVEGYAAQHPFTQQYADIEKGQVLATAYQISYTLEGGESLTNDYLFSNKPVAVQSILDNESTHILNYQTQQNTENSEEKE